MEPKYKLGFAICMLGTVSLLGAAAIYMDRDLSVSLILTTVSFVWIGIAYLLIRDIRWGQQRLE